MKEAIFSNYIINILCGGGTCKLFHLIRYIWPKLYFYLTIYLILTILAFTF